MIDECKPKFPYVEEISRYRLCMNELQVYGNCAGDSGCLLPTEGIDWFDREAEDFRGDFRYVIQRLVYMTVK